MRKAELFIDKIILLYVLSLIRHHINKLKTTSTEQFNSPVCPTRREGEIAGILYQHSTFGGRPVPPYVEGSPEPMFAFEFSNGAVLSVEFTEDALDDQQAQRGAWLELRTDDAAELQQKVQAFGLGRVVHPYTLFFYIQAPGGQVLRIA